MPGSNYKFLVLCFLPFFFTCISSANQPLESGGYSSTLISQDVYPRVFFFRASERPGKDPGLSYQKWEAAFERLMGIMGKVQDEEIPGLSKRNIDFFTRFKKRHPDQVVLMHYNGPRSPFRIRRLLLRSLDLLQWLHDSFRCSSPPG